MRNRDNDTRKVYEEGLRRDEGREEDIKMEK